MPDDIQSRIGFDASDAISSLNRLTGELDQYNAAIQEAAESTGEINKDGKQFQATLGRMARSAGALSNASGSLARTLNNLSGGGGFGRIITNTQDLENAVSGTVNIYDQFGNTISTVTRDAGQNFDVLGQLAQGTGDDLEEAGEKGEKSGKSVLLSWQSVIRIFAIQTIHRAITLITNAFADGLSTAVEYGTALAEVQTIGRDLGLSYDELSSKVAALSEEFAQPLSVVTEGLYQTLSNQVADGAQNFEFLATANKFAVAAVTDTASSVNLLSSTLNSYNIAASEADIVAGKLFKTIELGRIRGEEFANTFGRVTVLANQLGISLDEVLASIATLTVQGLKYNEAFTLINNVTLKLIRPTEALKEAYDTLGVASAEAGIQAFGFQGFLEQLSEQSGTTASEIGELFNRVRAIRGVLGLAGNQTEQYANTLREIQEAGGADLEAAFQEIIGTDAKQFQRSLEAIKNDFVGLGEASVSALVTVADAFGGGSAALFAFTGAIAAAGIAYLANVTGIIGITFAWITAQGSLTAVLATSTRAIYTFLATNPAGWAIIAASAVLGLVAAFNQGKRAIEAFGESIKEVNEATFANAEAAFNVRRRAAEQQEAEILSLTQRFLQERQRLFKADAAEAERLQRTQFGSLAAQVDSRLSEYERFVDAIRDTAGEASETIADLQRELVGIGDRLESFDFERSLRGLNDTQKTFAQIQKSQDLIREANDAIVAGDQDRADALLQQAGQIAKQAVSSADRSQNAVNVFRAEEQVRAVLAAQDQLVRDQIRVQQERVRTAESIRAEEETRAVRLKELQTQASELTKILQDGKVDPDFDEETARQNLANVTRQIQDELAKAGENAQILERYDPDVARIREKFVEAIRDPLTGAEVDITEAFVISFDRIVAQLKQQASQLSDEQKLSLADLGIDTDELVKGFAAAQNQIAKLPKDIKTAEEASREQLQAQLALNNAVSDQDVALQKVLLSLGKIQERGAFVGLSNETSGATAAIADFLGAAGNIASLRPILQGPTEGFNNLLNTLAATNAEIQTALSPETFDPQTFLQANKALIDGADALRNAGYADASKELAELAKSYQEIFNQQQRLIQAGVAAETLQPLEDRVKALEGAFRTQGEAAVDASQAVVDGSKANDAAIRSETQTVRGAAQAYRDLNAARAGGGGVEAAGRQFGGLIFRQLGGLIDYRQFGGQRGTDSILTGLTPGESVNTVAATRRFFPQIQAMNQNVTPIFRQEGGEVSNFGDININVTEATSARDTAREVMKQFKREERRDTFRLRRS